jgi:nucleoside-diphosphate-sugar epimerase
MSRVLLTGATGFIGGHLLAPLLQAGHEVHAITSREPHGDPGEAIWHRADLTDATAAEAVVREVAADALIHMAWYVEHGRYWQAPENVVWVEATLRLLRGFIAAGGRRAVIAGTCAEYEWSLDRYSDRTAPLAPATLYGVAKHATRLVAERFAANADVELAWGRIFMPYGPGESGARLLPSVIRALLAGEEALVSHGEQVRDFMYVEDVARAFAAILDSSAQGAINVGTGRGCTIRELVALAAETVGRPELVRWGALPPREGEPPRLVADVSRLEGEVGFRPQIDLREGVERTVASWREIP